jgi:hypothetical protein
VGTDIAGGEGPEDGVGQSMEQDIGIGMALQTAVVGNGYASQNQGAALDQRVNVVTHAHA